jgi:hypothetical protein
MRLFGYRMVSLDANKVIKGEMAMKKEVGNRM